MEEEREVIPPNPSGVALALAIIALVMAIIGTTMCGVIGGGIALVLGIVALCLGVSAKQKTNRKKGTGGFVIGIIATCFAIIMSFSFFLAGTAIKAAANERGLPLLSKHGGALTYGVIGMMISIGNEGNLDELKDELDGINGHISFTTD